MRDETLKRESSILAVVERNHGRHEQERSYQPYGPEEDTTEPSMIDFMNLAGEAEVVDPTITEDAAIAGKTLCEANSKKLIGDDVLVIAIEHGKSIITPKGNTAIQADDLVMVFARTSVSDKLLSLFTDDPITS